MQYSRRTAGFSLIQLLVAVLILGILMAVAMPIYTSAIGDAQRKDCRANMQAVANAEQQYRLKSASHSYLAVATATDRTTLATVTGTIFPMCPAGGSYTVLLSGTTTDGRTVPSGGLAVQCSVSGHGSFIPGTDTQ